jgi:beta-N-acetylhexosaminidase
MNRLKLIIYFVLFVLAGSFVLPGAEPDTIPHKNIDPPFLTKNTRWVDSVFNSMTPDERIAQLFMVAAYSNKDKAHVNEIKKLVQDYKVGGLIFFQGGPVRQALLTNIYQSVSRVPLLVSIDGEWGLAMRLDSTVQYPRQMTLGAIQDDSLIYQMGKQIAEQCKRIGIHVNLAPVADVNNNPLNPVISNRSFGEDKYNVARKAIAYMKGMQDAGVMANAKHFPGHGDTDSDSHKALPTINHTRERLDSLELYPFKEMIKHGLGSMMVAHLHIPSYDTTKNTASTLSKNVVTDLLKNDLQFKGLIFTDALNMKGVSKYFEPGVVDVKALLAGNDVLLFAEDVPTAIKAIKKAIESKEISQEEIDRRCRKILAAKQWAGLDKMKPLKIRNIYRDLNTSEAEVLNRKLAEASATLLVNKDSIIPLKRLDTLRIASLSLGYREASVFQQTLSNYTAVKHFGIEKDAKQAEYDSVLNWLKPYNLVIIAINNTNNNPKKDFGLTPQAAKMLKNVMRQSKVIVDVFSNPYILGKMDSLQFADGVIISYEYNEHTQDKSAQLIFGGIAAKGKLPVTASPAFRAGTGFETQAVRFKYVMPQEIGISPRVLARIDSIAMKGIKDKAYPGCQVFVAKDGNVFYRKSFGYHTYENKIKVKNDDVYDLASITKIAASTAAIMKLQGEKMIDIDDTLGAYLPELNGSNKGMIVMREMLAHQAGLPAWIPFWQRTMVKGEYKPGIYSTTQSAEYPLRVAEKLYIRNDYSDTLFHAIVKSNLGKREYKYSDLGYYFMQKIIEAKTGMPMDEYVRQSFYAPLGLATTTYKPREKFELNRIVPTEYDVKFRRQLVHGDVHDQGAAMLGGVGGHAGLFSSANDLGVLMQMLLQKGEYGGVRYLDSAVVNEFTRCQYCVDNKGGDNRRAIGFDKPETDPKKESPVCDCVSYMSYGHSGFTGTMTWVDPQYGLVYVFLSNRVYPDAEENKLAKQGIRSNIQKVIYEAISTAKMP